MNEIVDVNLILNVMIALFLYNVILKAIGASFMKQIMKTDASKQKKKEFRERIQEKLNEDK